MSKLGTPLTRNHTAIEINNSSQLPMYDVVLKLGTFQTRANSNKPEKKARSDAGSSWTRYFRVRITVGGAFIRSPWRVSIPEESAG